MGEKLIIFDFSGTLSLAAARFGQPASLTRSLRQSGLAGMGIDPPRYWQRIVAPTWQEASTTGRGFGPILAERLRRMAPRGRGAAEIQKAALGFVSAYIQGSAIDARWAPILAAVQAREQTAAVVATDHYPEATAGIIGHLGGFGITAVPAKKVQKDDRRRSFIVANSADIGYHKCQRFFWEALETRLGPMALERILVIDDFGANEADQSGYAGTAAVSRREKETRAVIRQAWTAPVTALPFVIDAGDNINDGFGRCIGRAGRAISKFLAAPGPPG